MNFLSEWSKTTCQWNLGSYDYILGVDANFLKGCVTNA